MKVSWRILFFAICLCLGLTACGITDKLSTESEPEVDDLSAETKKLGELMAPLFSGDTVKRETVMFLDYGQKKSLLYRVDKILEVTSYDGSRTYQRGKDYELERGRIVLLKGSAIPCISSKVYYGNGQMYWGEGTTMTQWQVCVTYTHSDEWEGFKQPCRADVFESLIQKFENGEDITIVFYGDSITYGANASFVVGCQPEQESYPLMLVKALADLYGYRVRYVNTGLSDVSRVPGKDYVPGDACKGTITYINPSVGGWKSQDGVDHFDTYVRPQIEKYGCDLFVAGFGMNDGSEPPRVPVENVKSMMQSVEVVCPDSLYLAVATMVPNPNAVGWYGRQDRQEEAFLAENLMSGKCAVACMTSVSKAVLERKEFMDYTGNNINHPNDFFSRVYAQTLFQALIGYENLK